MDPVGPPSDRIEQGAETAYGYRIRYAIDLLYYANTTNRRISAWVETDSKDKFFSKEYRMSPSFFERLLGRERPVPEEEHREVVLSEARDYAQQLAERRASHGGADFNPNQVHVGIAVRE